MAQAVAGSRRGQERQRLSDETSDLRNRALKQAEFPRLVGTSAPIGEVQTQVAQVAAAGTTVILRGETGRARSSSPGRCTGSPRAPSFVAVSCGAIPAGHRVGALRLCPRAFTGRARPGAPRDG